MLNFNKRDEGGVSEVVGTILTLGITVVLFTSVYAGVSTLREPEERDHVKFTADLEEAGVDKYVNITHLGGKELNFEFLEFSIRMEGINYQVSEEEDMKFINVPGDTWTLNEEVKIHDEGVIDFTEKVELMILNQNTDRVIYRSILSEEAPQLMEIKDAYIRYNQDWKNYVEQGNGIGIIAEIKEPEEDISVNATLQSEIDILKSGNKIRLDNESGNKYYNESLQVNSDAEEGTYTVKVVLENDTGVLEDKEYLNLNVGVKPAIENPKKLEIGQIEYTPDTPSHGDTFTLDIPVYNHHSQPVEAEWKVEDKFVGVEEVKNLSGSQTFEPGPAPTMIEPKPSFTLNGSGRHTININVTKEGWEPGSKGINIRVDPHVLVVKDRTAKELGEAEIMSNTLSGLNIDHDFITLSDENDVDNIPFQEHSVVLWMIGKDNGQDPYLEDAATHLNEYLEHEEGNNKGSLWIKGAYDLESLNLGVLSNKLGYSEFTSTSGDKNLKSDEDGPYGKYKEGIDISESSYYIVPESDVEDTLTDTNTDESYGVGYNQTNGTQRTVVDSFLIDSIDDPGARSNLVIDVIEWLTNITRRERRDVAVIEQSIEPDAPMYRDGIKITATIRNNGPDTVDLTNTIRLIRNGGEDIIKLQEDAEEVMIEGGNSTKVTFTWEALELGIQRFIIDADYLGQLDETNTVNNDIRYKDLDVTDDEIEVNVHYSTMVVDADMRDSEASNTTKEVIETLERLEYDKGADYNVTYLSDPAGDDPESIDNSTLSTYNSVFWITGDRGADTGESALTTGDKKNITSYLEEGGNLMLMGRHIADSLSAESDLKKYLGINSFNGKEEVQLLNGRRNNNVSHNLRYEIERSEYDTVGSYGSDGEVLFKGDNGHSIGSTNETMPSKALYMGVNLDNITGPQSTNDDFGHWDVNTSEENARAEFIYTVLWNFGKKEVIPSQQRPEFRVTDYDIRISNQQPRTSNSYIINATIENIGYKGESALVRFKEGNDHIGSRTPFIPASERNTKVGSTYSTVKPGRITVEMQWSPVNPGERPLKVRVDPVDQKDEVSNKTHGELMEFNNQAIIEQPVYYFYDDMEQGIENWEHDRNLMNIDGESPLNFINREDLDTNVVGKWDEDFSGSTEGSTFYDSKNGIFETDDKNVTSFTHSASSSAPRSFWMPETERLNETKNETKPIDVVFALDTSGSMHWDDDGYYVDLDNPDCRWYQARQATIRFIENLTKKDRAAIWTFDGSGDEEKLIPSAEDGLTPMTDSNKQDFIDALNGLGDDDIDGGTPFYDALGEAIENSLVDDSDASDDTRYEFVMGLTDGQSNADYKWNPDDDWDSSTWGGGLVGAPPMVFNMGMVADELHEYDSNYPEAPYWKHAPPHGGDPDEEYDLWNVADQTPGPLSQAKYGTRDEDNTTAGVEAGDPYRGHYYFAEESKDLTNVFEKIRKTISKISEGGAGGIKSVDPINTESSDAIEGEKGKKLEAQPMATEIFSDGFETGLSAWNSNGFSQSSDTPRTGFYCAESHANHDYLDKTIDLSGYTSAEFTFWLRDHHEMEDSGGAHDWVDVEVNDGTGWNDLGSRIDPDGDTSYDQYSRDLTSYVGNSNLEIRFHSYTSAGNEYWRLDDVLVEGTPTDDDGGGGDGDDYDIDRRNYRFLTTKGVEIGDTDDIESLRMSFMTKFWMTQGTNGGVLYLWGKDEGESSWTWDQDHRVYMKPEQSYTGNLKFDGVDNNASDGGPLDTGDGYTGLRDAKGDLPYWCFNGRSKSGTFGWRYVTVNVRDYLDEFNNFGNNGPEEIRVMFLNARFGGINKEKGWQPEMGWYIDNVQMEISANWSSDGPGYWAKTSVSDLKDKGLNPSTGGGEENYKDEPGHERFWMFGGIDSNEDYLPKGVDASLYTPLISVSNARSPVLSANLKFNLNDGAGLPPNGFRIEVSSDSGETWDSLTYGSRGGWNASGTDDNEVNGESYSGISEDGDYGWVDADSLLRVNADLSGWRGENIIIRFRIFTNTSTEQRYDGENGDNLPKAIFIDDVVVRETSTTNSLNSVSKTLQGDETSSDDMVKEQNDETVIRTDKSENIENGRKVPNPPSSYRDNNQRNGEVMNFNKFKKERFTHLVRRRKTWL